MIEAYGMNEYEVLDRDELSQIWEPVLGSIVWGVRTGEPPEGVYMEIGDPELWVFGTPELSCRRKFFAPGREHLRGTRAVCIVGRYSFYSAYADWELQRGGVVIGDVNSDDTDKEICREVLDGQVLEGISLHDADTQSLVCVFDLDTVLVVRPLGDDYHCRPEWPEGARVESDDDEWRLNRSDGLRVRKHVDGQYVVYKEEV